MSQFTVGILIPRNECHRYEDYATSQIAPYNIHLSVSPHVCYGLDKAAKDLSRDIRYMEQRIAESGDGICSNYFQSRLAELRSMTPAEYYREWLQFHRNRGGEFNDEGQPLSTSNPHGRWSDFAIALPVDRMVIPEDPSHAPVASDHFTDVDLIAAEGRIPFALITPDGVWQERGFMQWDGEILDDKGELAWHKQARRLLGQCADHVVLFVDAVNDCCPDYF